jgi:tripartite-type tricarboxylate transporter receptor subunit TctC
MMIKKIFRAFTIFALLAGHGLWAQNAGAQAQNAWPAGPIRILVGFPAGGASDVMARLVAQKLNESLGVTVVVDNRPGAAGTLAASLALQSPADGYTLLLASPTAITLAPSTLAGRINYDPATDFVPISKVAHYPLFWLVNPKLGVKDVQGFLAMAKEKPGKINFGSFGIVTSGGLAVEQLKLKAGIDVLHVPYNGSAPALQAILGGEIDTMFDTAITAMPNMRAGKLVCIGVASLKSSALAPDLPPVADIIAGFEADSWVGLMARKGTPDEVIKRVQSAVAAMVRDAELLKRFADLGAEPDGSTPDEFARFLREETDRYTKLVKESGIKVN